MTDKEGERGQWGRKIEFFLSMLGYMVGLGNLWRFPYICMRNGGGAFLIPFVFFLVFCGLPLYFVESAVGQFSGKGMIHVWDVCPLFQGLGYGMVIPLFLVNVYYNLIIAWTLYYIGNSFIVPLPWTTCTNDWNSDNCIEDVKRQPGINTTLGSYNGSINLANASIVISTNETTWITPQEDFWQQNVLQMSSGIEEIGHINWHLVLSLIGAWIVVGLCIVKGVKSVGKVVYVTATLPYLLLTVILIRGLTLDGSVDGVIMYLKPDFAKLLKLQVWIEAALQVFYSLGPGWGTIISMSSFNKFNNNCVRDSVVLSLLGEGTSVYSGLVIFTVLGFMAKKFSLPLDKIIKSGPGLGFVAYPEALGFLPGANIWSCLFFIMLLTVGLDSQFAACEAIIVVFTDSFRWLRRRRMMLTVAYCIFNFLLGLLFCTQAGIYIFQLIDWYATAFALPVFGFLECIIFGWIYGFERLSEDVFLMIKKRVPFFFLICIKFVSPVILLGLIISSFVSYKPPTYGTYTYPSLAVVFGTFLSVLPIIPIFVCALLAVKKANGNTVKEKFLNALKPSKNWKPMDYDENSQKTMVDSNGQTDSSAF